jgi:colanic acid biosynthesis glycosyl transferase WcaI
MELRALNPPRAEIIGSSDLTTAGVHPSSHPATQAEDCCCADHLSGESAARTRPKPCVLFLNRSYWPDAEATGQLLTELCEDLANAFEVTVIAGQPNQNPADIPFKSWGRQRRAGVTIRRVPHLRLEKRSLVGRGLNMLTYFVSAAVIAMFAVRPAVVVVETDPFLLAFLGRFLQWRHRCRLVVYLQDIYPDIAVAIGRVRDGWLTRVLRRLLFAVYRCADRVVVLGQDMRAVLTEARIPPERIAVLPNWVDTARIFPAPAPNQFREREGLSGRFVVMYSGNLGLCQNLDEVLEAAKLLRKRENIQLMFIGDGASRARLEKAARDRQLDNVRFLPYQPKNELAQSLSAADLQLVPVDPRITGCLVPSKLYGILAAGVPVLAIADERSEVSRVVRESATGQVVPPGNPELLAESIGWFADHPRERKAMGCRARQLAVQEYDRKMATGRFGKLIGEVLTAMN